MQSVRLACDGRGVAVLVGVLLPGVVAVIIILINKIIRRRQKLPSFDTNMEIKISFIKV